MKPVRITIAHDLIEAYDIAKYLNIYVNKMF